MWIRKALDITGRDLIRAAAQCFVPGSATAAERAIGSLWAGNGTLPVLSVRSGWDLLLTATAWRPGDEVICSGLTIPDMPRILEHHGLVPVSVDLDVDTLSPKIDQVAARINHRTRAILVAHLFGGLCDLREIAAVAQRHGLMLIEDCAQSWIGDTRGDGSVADVSLYSFGPIKTQTALGGGVVCVCDAALQAKMRRLHDFWPRQSRASYLRCVLKHALLGKASTWLGMQLIYHTGRALGGDHDAWIGGAARAFPGSQFFDKIRRQPAVPLLRLLHHRLSRFDSARIDARRRRGLAAAMRLSSKLRIPGLLALRPTWWVLGVLVERPRALIESLWQAGFDATQTSSLRPLCAQDTPVVEAMLQHLVFLPFDHAMPTSELDRMIDLILASTAAPPSIFPLSAPQHRPGGQTRAIVPNRFRPEGTTDCSPG